MTGAGLLLVLLTAGISQEASSSPRVAAVRFAVANGLAVSLGRVTVATETTFNNVDSRRQPMTEAARLAEAQSIAEVVGSMALTGRAADSLRCHQGRCAPLAGGSVLVVNQPEPTQRGTQGVLVSLYLPSDRPDRDGFHWMAVVELEPLGSGWKGVRYYLPPRTVSVKVGGSDL
jgi:hypothetical protein